ncbi:MarR family winged helix-turn-helix transcriptional regulator [Streptomyces tubercidicus]|uniref:MarR family winged helix-turn-helix transcriptional regulator n=1 Tax=Streptomyces tubercidicus TaxID=47759 RepID=UPI0037AF17E1
MPSADRDLPQLLGDARRWFDEALLAALEEAGASHVSPTQVGLFSVLDEDGTTVSELARRMGVTRQAAHQAAHGLVKLGLLEQAPDPASARRRLIQRTPEGQHVHQCASLALERLEETLAERIGQGSVAALRAALEAPWGPVTPSGPVRNSDGGTTFPGASRCSDSFEQYGHALAAAHAQGGVAEAAAGHLLPVEQGGDEPPQPCHAEGRCCQLVGRGAG